MILGTAMAQGLLEEPMLHPLDGFTAHTLPAGHAYYAQSIGSVPLPSFGHIALHERVTTEIDFLPLIGGLFVRPHLPVPSFNLRARLTGGDIHQPAVAVEGMFQYLWLPTNQEDGDRLQVQRTGATGWLRVNTSIPVYRRLWVHASLGATWVHAVVFTNPTSGETRSFRNDLSPDVSVALDWRPSRYLSVHLTVSQGTTFTYSDNIPHKRQLGYGVRIAPLAWVKPGFLRTIRLEIPGLHLGWPVQGGDTHIWVPLVPYIYWQFPLYRPRRGSK